MNIDDIRRCRLNLDEMERELKELEALVPPVVAVKDVTDEVVHCLAATWTVMVFRKGRRATRLSAWSGVLDVCDR
ncbi:MAG: hypothetical protein VX427_09725 [Acidobacteriota bacterium]|nr:hypothetical protein [Acidobacteriota bacterium]